MKKLILIILALLPISANAQQQQAVVKLKSGTTLSGVIKSIDPLDAVTIMIAGVETKIKMSDIDKIEGATDVPSQNNVQVEKDDWRNRPFTENYTISNQMNVAFDTNGPMGKCLFPQNDSGNIIYSGIIESDLSADKIAELAKEFVHSIPKIYLADISDELDGTTKVGCEVELKVGKKT